MANICYKYWSSAKKQTNSTFCMKNVTANRLASSSHIIIDPSSAITTRIGWVGSGIRAKANGNAVLKSDANGYNTNSHTYAPSVCINIRT